MNHKAKHSMGTQVRERISHLTEDARSRLLSGGERLMDDAQVQGERALKNSRAWIVKHPAAAVGAAFLAGAIASRAFKRKAKE